MITRIKKALKILINYESKRRVVSPNELIQSERVKLWFDTNGDETLRLDYSLNENSLVFDLGGYKGEFAADIYCRYNSEIYIFEPVLSFFEVIKKKFLNNNKIEIFNFGLAGRDSEMQISNSDNSSSVFLITENSETIQLKSIVEFIKSKNITNVDLIKINIEGGEYEVLESLIENNLITIFDNIQVQFHDFIIENALERMNKIQIELAKTHELTYQYEFVWENWKLK